MNRFTRLSSPYINHFLSADTIVPGYANPQSLNRYSYVVNNPLRYTDPSGHCIWDLCIVEGIGAVELVMAASAMYAGTVAIAHHDEMTHSITNAMDEIFQRRTNGRKNIESIEANSGLTADSTDFYPSGFNPKPPKIKCGFWCKLLGIGGSGVVACVSVFDDECINAVPNPHSEKPPTSTPTLTLTPTATSTGTPSCPPFKQCSTQTSTSTPTNTSTPAPTPSPAYSAPYQNSPWYSHPGVDEE